MWDKMFWKKIFQKESAEVLAQKELEEAKVALLQAQSAQEYARRMSDYHSDRIKRLTLILSEKNQ